MNNNFPLLRPYSNFSPCNPIFLIISLNLYSVISDSTHVSLDKATSKVANSNQFCKGSNALSERLRAHYRMDHQTSSNLALMPIGGVTLNQTPMRTVIKDPVELQIDIFPQ